MSKHGGVPPLTFVSLLHSLYEHDVLSEEAILMWHGAGCDSNDPKAVLYREVRFGTLQAMIAFVADSLS